MSNLEIAKDLGQGIYTKPEVDTKTTNISHSGKSAMLSGTASISNTTLMAGMSTTLYTGNGTTQSIDAGVDLATQWGDSVSETYGGLVWIKSRNAAYNNRLYDTIRGVVKYIHSDATNSESTDINDLTSFNSNGFSAGSSLGLNGNTTTYASWIFQTTHRISGTTNHGKNYTCHYNPITGFTIVKYEGSGIAGHEIPHHLGRKLGLSIIKGLDSAFNWDLQDGVHRLRLNTTDLDQSTFIHTQNIDNISLVDNNDVWNDETSTYILYGWANSYYDDAGVLNGNYEVGVYQGTGASGNKITTRGKPAWVMIKRLDSTGNWVICNNQMSNMLFANSSSAELGSSNITIPFEDGFSINLGEVGDYNASGGQYLYMVVYDNDSGSGKSKFDMPSETSNLNFTNLVASFTNGVDGNGVVNTIKNLGSFTVAPTGGFDL